MVIERSTSESGATQYKVPSWLMNVLVGATSAWALGMTTGWIYCYAQLSVGGRFTAAQGDGLDARITRLEEGLPPQWLINDVEEVKIQVQVALNKIERNHDLLIELRNEP